MHKVPIVEERSKRTPKVGDIVRFSEFAAMASFSPRLGYTDVRLALNNMVGIVTELYHDGNTALVLFTDGRLHIDRTDFFTVL